MTTPHFLDLISVGVFAVSGCLAAGRKSLDWIGVLAIAMVTAVGGGTLRDLLLNRHPIFWTADPSFLYVIAGSVFLTLVYVRFRGPPDQVLRIADAIGLAVYSIVGAELALLENRAPAVAVVMGTVTGTAGGVLRDMLCNDVPILFREGYLYATAAIVGAALYVALKSAIDPDYAGYLGMAVVAGLRLGSIAFRWNLPRFTLRDLKKR
jgi:uncharacterized membrane protein YeiH